MTGQTIAPFRARRLTPDAEGEGSCRISWSCQLYQSPERVKTGRPDHWAGVVHGIEKAGQRNALAQDVITKRRMLEPHAVAQRRPLKRAAYCCGNASPDDSILI